MSFALAGSKYAFNYGTYDMASGLNVAASIFDISSGSPSLVSKVAMSEVLEGNYAGSFTPEDGKIYAVIVLVYTDPGFTTVDASRSPSIETIQSASISGGGSSGQVVFQSNINLRGVIIQPLSLSGIVTLTKNIATC